MHGMFTYLVTDDGKRHWEDLHFGLCGDDDLDRLGHRLRDDGGAVVRWAVAVAAVDAEVDAAETRKVEVANL